jgi:hypothetical protein
LQDAHNAHVHRKVANTGTTFIVHILQLKFRTCFCKSSDQYQQPSLEVVESHRRDIMTMRQCVLHCNIEECYKLLFVLVNRRTKYDRLKWNEDIGNVNMITMKTMFYNLFLDHDRITGNGLMREIPQRSVKEARKDLFLLPANVVIDQKSCESGERGFSTHKKRKDREMIIDSKQIQSRGLTLLVTAAEITEAVDMATTVADQPTTNNLAIASRPMSMSREKQKHCNNNEMCKAKDDLITTQDNEKPMCYKQGFLAMILGGTDCIFYEQSTVEEFKAETGQLQIFLNVKRNTT